MKRQLGLRHLPAVLFISVLLIACQGAVGGGSTAPSDAPSSTPDAVPSQAVPPEATVTVQVVEGDGVGAHLVDAEGNTLYVFLNDMEGMSHCVGECATSWPPFTVAPGDEPEGDDGLTAALATIERDDGSLQVTLAGWPLYHFAGDSAPGDVNGEGANDVWFVARPDGSLPGDAEPSVGQDDYYSNY